MRHPSSQPHRSSNMAFLLGDHSRENAKRSIKGLIAHNAESGPDEPLRSLLYLVVNTKAPLVAKSDQTPRIIPLTNKLHKIDEKTIALITRDTSYRAQLVQKDSPTDDLFHEIIPYTKAKLIGHSSKARLRLFRENDLIIADARIYKHLPEVLGPQFYARNKKVPFKILMSRPTADKKTHGKIDQLFDAKYVRAQVKSIVGNTSFIPPLGTCLHIAVGYTDWKVSDLLVNINDVVSYLTDEKFRPIGGVLRMANIHSVLIKTSNSVALPVKESLVAPEDDESELSDF
ncbi:hypothetical protein PUMCH_000967 [Australozyma saopauloensis]|uniref:Ribosome biogenesis protein UTP30 n=1 Tax=Australozyma saopauloensis TaxID=291208 RepID=A0AAX4H5J9_9ASCO|nr:hypothetical protein PUMCH_000967 [[Candida] saopauloensis]